MKVLFLAASLAWVPLTSTKVTPPARQEVQESVAEAAQRFAVQSREPGMGLASRAALSDQLLAAFDPAELSGQDFFELGGLLAHAKEARSPYHSRGLGLAATPTADGAWAAAALVYFDFTPAREREGMSGALRTAWQRWLEHPACVDTVLARVPWLQMLCYEKRLDQSALLPSVQNLRDAILGLEGEQGLQTQYEYFGIWAELCGPRRPAALEETRKRVLDAHERHLLTNGRNGGVEARIAYLQGAAARGELVGRPAPELNFRWSSEGAEALADYRGRVVLIDFWSTQCAPCINEFPRLEELRQRYEDYDFVLLGLTTPQGIVPLREEGRVSCTPREEPALLSRFLEERDVQWPVALFDGDVCHPDFVRRGIPHKALLDPSGNVVFNQPIGHMPITAWYAHIDACLRGAGLPAPPATSAGERSR